MTNKTLLYMTVGAFMLCGCAVNTAEQNENNRLSCVSNCSAVFEKDSEAFNDCMNSGKKGEYYKADLCKTASSVHKTCKGYGYKYGTADYSQCYNNTIKEEEDRKAALMLEEERIRIEEFKREQEIQNLRQTY